MLRSEKLRRRSGEEGSILFLLCLSLVTGTYGAYDRQVKQRIFCGIREGKMYTNKMNKQNQTPCCRDVDNTR